MIEQLTSYKNSEVNPDISAMSFAAAGTVSRYCLHHSVVNYNNQLIWVGGSTTGPGEKFFDYLNGSAWTAMPKPMPEARMGHNAVVVGSKLYVYCGKAATLMATKIYSYDFVQQLWEDLGNVPITSIFGDCCVVGTKIYYFGGMINGETDLAPASFPSYEYDTVAKTWRNLNLPLSGRFNLSVASHKENIYILGGRRDNVYFKEFWCYNTITGEFTAKKAPPEAISGHRQFVSLEAGWCRCLVQLTLDGHLTQFVIVTTPPQTSGSLGLRSLLCLDRSPVVR